jgi:hypothetical protein
MTSEPSIREGNEVELTDVRHHCEFMADLLKQVDLIGTRLLRWDNSFYTGAVGYLQNSA